jgi:hypothetical protein
MILRAKTKPKSEPEMIQLPDCRSPVMFWRLSVIHNLYFLGMWEFELVSI